MKNSEFINVKSSMMKQIGYNSQKKELIIVFSNDVQQIYPDISPETFEKFVAAESKGKFFHQFIKTKSNSDKKEVKKETASSNKHGLSILDANEDESASIMVKTHDFRAKNGRLLYTIYATVLGWNAGAKINGKIKEDGGCEIQSIDFSFPKKKMYEYIPQSKTILEEYIEKFNASSAHPLGKMLGLNLRFLAEEIDKLAGSEIFYLPKWLLTDTTDQGLVDMKKVNIFDINSSERDLLEFAKSYQAHFVGRREEADRETLEWCDLMVHDGGWG